MPYEPYITQPALAELKAICVFDRRRIVADIKDQLTDEPTVPTRHRKCLGSVSAGFEHVPPVWELRVGDFRVFYDVAESSQIVYLRAIRRKDPEQTTEEVIS